MAQKSKKVENLRAQSGFGSPKQAQVEHFVKLEKFDILHLQEAQILEDTFENCNYITRNYSIITNNARNPYGTASLVANSLEPVNIKLDTQGRVIVFDIGAVTFANVYLPSGNDTVMRNLREEYISLSIPQLLINRKENGCIGGDWNCITEDLMPLKIHLRNDLPVLNVLLTLSRGLIITVCCIKMKLHFPDFMQAIYTVMVPPELTGNIVGAKILKYFLQIIKALLFQTTWPLFIQ